MKTLTNVFSREKSLLYFCVWDDSDRKGIELVGGRIQTSLFTIPPKGKKGSVWYEKRELERLKIKTLRALTSTRSRAWQNTLRLMVSSWNFLKPYATKQKAIRTVEEFEAYYQYLVDFWVCLNSFVYEVLDDDRVDRRVRARIVQFRDTTERYTEIMSRRLTDFVRRHAVLRHLFNVVTKGEVVSTLRGTLPASTLRKIRQRRNGCFMLNGTVYPLTKLKTTLKKKGLAFERVARRTSELQGMTAYGGFAKGRVRIVHGFRDLGRVMKGDILVTQMTNPKYLPAIIQSAAIVADEGGVLCHAAITARELKKPCVIGTKVATQVLKDGDLVEVDAEKGLVKVIKKS